MKKTATLCAAAVICTAAHAAPLLPPAQYDRPYAGPVIQITETQGVVTWLCAREGYPNATACGVLYKDGLCVLYLPRVGESWRYKITPKVYAGLRRHETAHCNGWAADHPPAR